MDGQPARAGAAPRGDARALESSVPRSPIAGRITERRMPPPRRVLAISSLGVFVAFVDATIVNIAFPDIRESFPQASLSELSWVLNAYNIVFAAFLVAAGRLADLIGRNRTFIAGLWVFTVASALCALAPSAGALIAARMIQALGAALLIPSSLGLVIAAFSPEHRAHAVALSTAVAALAAGVGPSLGGLLITVADWRLVFLVNIPVGLAAIVLARSQLVESRAPGRRQIPDLPGSVLFALATALLVLAIVQGPEWGWTDVKFLGALAASALLGVVVVRRCARHRAPIIDLALLRIRAFAVANAMTIVGAAAFFGYTLCNVLFLTSVWRYSILDAGLALTPGPVVAVLVAGPSSRIVERLGPRAMLVPGALIWGAAVLWMVARVGPAPDFVSEWLPGMVLLGIGAGMCLPNLTGAAVASAPGESFATASALNSVARQIGAAIGVAAVVAIVGAPSPQEAPAAFDEGWTFSAV
jgi:NTE family protein